MVNDGVGFPAGWPGWVRPGEGGTVAQHRMVPLTAGAILVDGIVYTHTSVRGNRDPDLHPLVRRFLQELPAPARERFLGRCVEPVLVSDRLYAAEAAGSPPLTPARARAALWGAKMRITRVREPDDPCHGQVQQPCRSCAALLDWIGVEVLT